MNDLVMVDRQTLEALQGALRNLSISALEDNEMELHEALVPLDVLAHALAPAPAPAASARGVEGVERELVIWKRRFSFAALRLDLRAGFDPNPDAAAAYRDAALIMREEARKAAAALAPAAQPEPEGEA